MSNREVQMPTLMLQRWDANPDDKLLCSPASTALHCISGEPFTNDGVTRWGARLGLLPRMNRGTWAPVQLSTPQEVRNPSTRIGNKHLYLPTY